MSVLWPQLPNSVAEREYDVLAARGSDNPRLHHPAQIYTPLGGARAGDVDVRRLAERITELAGRHGYPRTADQTQRITFDRAAAPVIREALDLTWSEAGQRGIWSFVALVALPHITRWRWSGTANAERWIASDLTRHTWSRLWWQAVTFEPHPELLPALSESDLNQLLERRTLGGDPRVVCALAHNVIEHSPDGDDRRPLIRDVAARLLRRLAFIDTAALSEASLDALCREETIESLRRLKLAEHR